VGTANTATRSWLPCLQNTELAAFLTSTHGIEAGRVDALLNFADSHPMLTFIEDRKSPHSSSTSNQAEPYAKQSDAISARTPRHSGVMRRLGAGRPGAAWFAEPSRELNIGESQ